MHQKEQPKVATMKQYDIDIFLTTEAPDVIGELLDGPLKDSPLSTGSMGRTFDDIQKIAESNNGGWTDWEPYRVTFSFKVKEDAASFIREIYKKFPKEINIKV